MSYNIGQHSRGQASAVKAPSSVSGASLVTGVTSSIAGGTTVDTGVRSAKLDAISLLDMAKSAGQPQVKAEIFKSTEFAEEVSKEAGVRSFRQFCRHVATNYPVDRLQPYSIGKYMVYGRRMQRPNLDLLCLVVFEKQNQHLVHSFMKFSDVHLLDFIISNFLYHSDRRLLAAKLKNIKLVVDVLRTLFGMDSAVMNQSDSALQNMNIQKYAKDVAKQSEEQATYNQNKQKQHKPQRPLQPQYQSRKERMKPSLHTGLGRDQQQQHSLQAMAHTQMPAPSGYEFLDDSPINWPRPSGPVPMLFDASGLPVEMPAPTPYLDTSLLSPPQLPNVVNPRQMMHPTHAMHGPPSVPTALDAMPHPYYIPPSPGLAGMPNGMFAQTLRPGISDDPLDTMYTPPIPGTGTPDARGMMRMQRSSARSRSRSPANSLTYLTEINAAQIAGAVADATKLSHNAQEFYPTMAGLPTALVKPVSQTREPRTTQRKPPVVSAAPKVMSPVEPSVAAPAGGVDTKENGATAQKTPGLGTTPSKPIFAEEMQEVNAKVTGYGNASREILQASIERARKRDEKTDDNKEREYRHLCKRGEAKKTDACAAIKNLLRVVEEHKAMVYKTTAGERSAVDVQHRRKDPWETALEAYTDFERTVQSLGKGEQVDLNGAWRTLQEMFDAFSMKNALHEEAAGLFMKVLSLVKENTVSKHKEPTPVAIPTAVGVGKRRSEKIPPQACGLGPEGEEAKEVGYKSDDESSGVYDGTFPDSEMDDSQLNGTGRGHSGTESRYSDDDEDDEIEDLPPPTHRKKRGHKRTMSQPELQLFKRIRSAPRDDVPPGFVKRMKHAFKKQIVKKALRDTLSFDFDVEVLDKHPEVSGNCLVMAAMFLLDRYHFCEPGVLTPKGLDLDTLIRFFYVIQEGYNLDVSYHNHQHACDILVTTNWFLENASVLERHVSPFEHFVLLVAAACHDVGHTGHNNDYHHAMNSSLVTKNTESPLENHHIQFTMAVINKSPGCNWFSGLSPAQQRDARTIISRTIMMTDMASHDKQLLQMEGLATVLARGQQLSHEQKMQLLEATLHFSDVANGVKRREISEKWAIRIIKEFRRQGQDEKDQFGSVRQTAPIFQSDVPLEKTQQGWLKMLRRFVEAWVGINEDCQWMLPQIDENLTFWQQYKEQLC